ncbi:MAG TPA: hypothetical protein VHB70_19225, partial [Parafilimonas sp.]|nr:hypothetical protein [Parafilimonas sp.]
MKKSRSGKLHKVSTIRRYRFKTITSIAFLWTLIDITVILVFNTLPSHNKLGALLLRELVVFIASGI